MHEERGGGGGGGGVKVSSQRARRTNLPRQVGQQQAAQVLNNSIFTPV